jgi:ribosomal-protein-serine acetyltransferase
MEKRHLPEKIEAGRIYLKKHSLDLAEMMFNYVDEDRERLGQFLPWVDLTKTIDDERGYVQLTLEKWERFELFDYGIFRLSDGVYMGNVGVHSLAWNHDRCELGYWILGKFEGKGYMSEAVLALESVCFDSGFHRVEIRCDANNKRSASIPQRNAYLFEARLNQDTIINSKVRDTLIFAKLRSPLPAESHGLMGLDFVYVFASDVAQSKKWYEKVLGLSPVVDIENYAEFRVAGSGLCLHPADSKSPLSTGGSVGYWRVLDFQKAVDYFKAHGAVVYRGPLDIGNSNFICQVRDPFGNVIGLTGRKRDEQ